MRRAVAVVLLAGLLVSGCGDDEPATPSGAGSVSGRPDAVSGRTSSVLVPTGTVELQVGAPQDEVTTDEAADGTTHPAPDGTTYVGVDWQYLPGHGLPSFAAALMHDDEQRVRLTLVAGGERHDLGTIPADAGDVFVPVTGSGEDATVEVEFDGEIGTSDDPGAFAPLAELGEGDRLSCSDLRARTGTTAATCDGLSLTVPWLPSLGWSERGWTAVQVSTSTTAYRAHRSEYAVDGLRDASIVDGQPPVWTQEMATGPGTLTETIVGPAPVSEIRVVRRGDARLLSGTGPDDVRYALTATITP